MSTPETTALPYPWHPQAQEQFPWFDYRSPVGPRDVVCDYGNPANQVGHQQRAFTMWWALQRCRADDLGLDIGASRGLTPYCIHVDLHGGEASHAVYGGSYGADVIADAADLSMFPSDTFPYLGSNHSLEHIAALNYGGGDAGVVQVLCRQWLRVLRKGGIMALVVPDQAHVDVLRIDSDHKHAWRHDDFRPRVLDHVLHLAELLEFDTFHNNFSFNAVLQKR